ncbi:MAG TPA: hypothetical protein VK427_26650, partial [Kofleriaceae bacterium]|nr:hypothetical protein [Kofleriaceae bacterium]
MRTLIIAVAVLSACKKPDAKPAAAGSAAPAMRLAADDIATVKRGELFTGPRISGTLSPASRSVVRAEIGGSVVAI